MRKYRQILPGFAAMILLAVMIAAAWMGTASTAKAASDPRLVDGARLLDSEETWRLTNMLDEISDRQKVDVVVVTVEDCGGLSPMEFADDYYDYHNYGFGADRDGILLLLSMGERDYWMSTTGYGITAFTDYGIDYIADRFVPYLSDGDYYEGFETFANFCDIFITEAKNGRPFDINHKFKEPFAPGRLLLISLVIGVIAGGTTVMTMRGQLRNVHFQNGAGAYEDRSRFHLTREQDIFLYHTITKTEIPKDNGGGGSSTHSSSSGSSHGGGGGKF